MIEFSIAEKNTKPGDASSTKKVYATAQCKGTLTADKMADHISRHDSKYNRADILGVLYSAAKCMEEHLLDGYQVEIYEIGTFYPVIHSEGADSRSKFKKSNINGLTINWRRSKRFKKIYENHKVKFQFAAGTRASQVEMKKKAKQKIHEEIEAARALSAARRESSSEE